MNTGVRIRREHARFTSRWTGVDGVAMHHRESVNAVRAEGPPVVLVHGLLVSSTYLMPAARHLAADFHVYAPDLPGYGRSGKPHQALNVPELADALAGWAKAAGVARAAYLGNSFGCQVVAELAVHHPDLVDRLVLTGPTVDPHASSPLRQGARWLRDASREDPRLGLLIARGVLRAGPARAVATFRHMMDDRIEENLPRVRAPALVVRGGRDPIVPPEWAEAAAQLLPRGSLREVPGAPHALNYSAPLELARVVHPFLSLPNGGTQ